MAVSAEFIAFLEECLAPLGPIQSRRMFGGAGLYCDGVMFALIADDAVYLKANDDTSAAFKAEGLKPFTYAGKAKPVTMSYWRAPERVFDDPDEFVEWARVAIGVAKAHARAKPKAKPKSKIKRSAAQPSPRTKRKQDRPVPRKQ